MVSEVRHWAVLWRLSGMLALTVIVSLLVERTHLYATSLIVLLVVLMLGAGLLRRMGAGVALPRVQPVSGPADYLQALLDTVPAALIIIREEGGRAALANRAAHRLTRTEVSRLSDIEILGAEEAARIGCMKAGNPELLQLADGRHVLVSVSEFDVGGERHRLAALQFVTGQLDAVEMKAWRDMLRVLRHEIMNSLTPIASLSESLSADPSLIDVRTSIDTISRRSRGLMQFVERYREVANPVVVSPEAVEAAALLRNIERLTASDCARAEVQPSFVVDPPSLAFEADPSLLEQTIINLLKNAVEAVCDIPNPRIQVRIEMLDDEVCLSVADNGGGIAPERREQVFLPFFTTKRSGSGIGLSVSRNIAIAHGGRIVYEPGATGGSEFRLFLGKAALSVRS